MKSAELRIIIIVQARMRSKRLPGKVLKSVSGKPLLSYLFERLKRVQSVDGMVVAATTHDADQPLVDFCFSQSVSVFRGKEEDPLDRYFQAARQHKADVIVRITADCPLMDPKVVDSVIHHFLENYPQYDYVSNCHPRTFPRGMDVEVFSFTSLEDAWKQAKLPQEREHVTLYFYTHPERYHLGNVPNKRNESHHRWTVDTPEDFQLISLILENLSPKKPNFTMEDMLLLLEQHPDWVHINAHIEQKPLEEKL